MKKYTLPRELSEEYSANQTKYFWYSSIYYSSPVFPKAIGTSSYEKFGEIADIIKPEKRKIVVVDLRARPAKEIRKIEQINVSGPIEIAKKEENEKSNTEEIKDTKQKKEINILEEVKDNKEEKKIIISQDTRDTTENKILVTHNEESITTKKDEEKKSLLEETKKTEQEAELKKAKQEFIKAKQLHDFLCTSFEVGLEKNDIPTRGNTESFHLLTDLLKEKKETQKHCFFTLSDVHVIIENKLLLLNEVFYIKSNDD